MSVTEEAGTVQSSVAVTTAAIAARDDAYQGVHGVVVEGLRKSYGATVAVDGISFTVRRGEVFGLLGPNGAGKTTTIEILEGLRQADAGRVAVCGLDPATAGAALKERIGIALQRSELYPRLTVREVLRLFGTNGAGPALLATMRRGNLDGVVTLPGTLAKALHGGQANLSVTYDPARQAMAGIVQSLVAQVADHVDRRLTGRHQVLFVRTAPLGGRVLDQFSYTLPGIVALTLIQVGLFATTMPLIQLRQSGVLHQLGATPLRRGVLAAAQIGVRVMWLVALIGLVLLAGRYWWPADIFRQLVWRVLEPAGLLRRREVQEDHTTRRVARVLGGAVLLGAAVVLSVGQGWGWLLVASIGALIFLDAAFDFCLLCALTYYVGRRRAHSAGEIPDA